ncbi:hypothetical protein LPJ60_004598 [Coemansia sp. RSA 2675]|uniref:BHLH domain-containing protein n=2 Tax=Coemansia TaxID=4863 RepID=A0A9W8GJB5_9FUNG|nr:hypothetical protein LPJ60_004598 [Coemansia sp. RSA 2675]KAJ2690402.1 hypothetical protein IWW39_000801 [Coemansia spiralis]KAJ2791566.1 hypothetical protein GGI18_001045 [Coemansia linderi]
MYHQPQVYQPAATVSSARHMYVEQHGLCAPSGIRHYSHARAAGLAPLVTSSNSVHAASVSSPSACYSPRLSLSSDSGTVIDYGTIKSPSLSYSSSLSKTASPAPPAPATTQTKAALSGVRRRRGARSVYSAEEKEMRRKISHSAIEKRRRERTNNVLKDLQVMVPWLSKSNKVQKLEILEAAAQYIKDLRSASGAPVTFDHSRMVSSVSSQMDDEDDEDEDDEPLPAPISTSPRAMKVNFLLS